MLSSEDVQENPGSLALTASWVLIFALMLLIQWRNQVPSAQGWLWDPLPVSTVTSHRVGDMTWLEVRQGQAWRLVTATFIHFGLLHLVLNGLAMVSLGRLVEPWYRTGPFLAVCLAIGGLGNLIGGALRQGVSLARPWLASYAGSHHWPGVIERFLRGQAGPGVAVSIHTGGGSTILLGLLTLAAVVGWRSRTRTGSHLQKQMIILLGLTAVLGIALSNLVDNYGHFGGAVMGVVFGLLDRPIFHLSDRKWFRASCWIFVVAVAGTSFGAAAWQDRIETRYRQQRQEIIMRAVIAESTRMDLERIYGLYARLTLRSPYFKEPFRELDFTAVSKLLDAVPMPPVPSKPTADQIAQERRELEEVLARLRRNRTDLWGDSIATDLATLRELGQSALEEPPDYQHFYEFLVAWRPAFKTVAADEALWEARFIELERNSHRPR